VIIIKQNAFFCIITIKKPYKRANNKIKVIIKIGEIKVGLVAVKIVLINSMTIIIHLYLGDFLSEISFVGITSRYINSIKIVKSISDIINTKDTITGIIPLPITRTLLYIMCQILTINGKLNYSISN